VSGWGGWRGGCSLVGGESGGLGRSCLEMMMG